MKKLIVFFFVALFISAPLALADCPELPEGYNIKQVQFKVSQQYLDLLFVAEFPKLSTMKCERKHNDELHFDLSQKENTIKVSYKNAHTNEVLKKDTIPLLVFYLKHMQKNIPAFRGKGTNAWVDYEYSPKFFKVYNFSQTQNKLNSEAMNNWNNYDWISDSMWSDVEFLFNKFPESVKVTMY